MKIDIAALAAHLSTLVWLHLTTNRQSELSAVLERLRENIIDNRWQRKILLFHTVNALGLDWNEVAGKKEFAKLGTVTPDEDDLEVLQLHIDLCRDEISFSERVKLFDRVLDLSNILSDRLQYQGAKAQEYFLIGDIKTAANELTQAIEFCRKAKSEEKLTRYERLKLSNCLELLGVIEKKKVLIGEAAEILHGLLSDDKLTPIGQMHLYRQLGDCHRHTENWKAAESAYREALSHKDDAVCRIFLAETLLHLNSPTDANEQLSSIDTATLDAPGYTDFVFTLAATAIHTGNKKNWRKLENF